MGISGTVHCDSGCTRCTFDNLINQLLSIKKALTLFKCHSCPATHVWVPRQQAAESCDVSSSTTAKASSIPMFLLKRFGLIPYPQKGNGVLFSGY